LESSLCL